MLNDLQKWAESRSIPSWSIEELRTICSELCLNAMEHGNQMVEGLKVWVRINYEAPLMVIEVLDRGKGIPLNLLSKTRKKLEVSDFIDDVRARGWGLMLITNMAETVQTVSEKDWNGLRIVYRVPGTIVMEG